MSRVLFAWELGGNLGHLSRDIPVAERLREEGYQVAFALRDMRLAAELLIPRKLAYVQAPVCNGHVRMRKPPINYAGLLEAEGWRDAQGLLGYLHAWLGTLALTGCDAVVADHAPGALVAAHIAGKLAIPFGSGFEIPPDVEPMPGIRVWEQHSTESLLASERQMLGGVNAVVRALGGTPFHSLSGIFGDQPILATLPELDHYGTRNGACYVGSIHGLGHAKTVAWPSGEGARIVAYLRPQHKACVPTLEVLKARQAVAICVIPGAGPTMKSRYGSDFMTIHDQPIDMGPLLTGADAVICNAGIGVTGASLLHQVPLVMIPTTVEQYLCARRVEALGAGKLIDGKYDKDRISSVLTEVVGNVSYRKSAQAFCEKHPDATVGKAVSDTVAAIKHRISIGAAK